MSYDLHEALADAHRDEETIEVRAHCTAADCRWRGEAEIYEGEFAYPCEGCDRDGTLERDR